MQPTYYYPTKLSIGRSETVPGEDETDFENAFYDRKWRRRSRKLQKRRWEKIHNVEMAKQEERNDRLQKIRQRRWLRAHGWPSIAQPLV